MKRRFLRQLLQITTIYYTFASVAINNSMYKRELSLGYLTGSIFNLLKKKLQKDFKHGGYDLKIDVFPILNRLYDQDGISQQTIADWFQLDRHVISRRLDELEGQGFVQRKDDPSSRRNKLIFLTPYAIDNKNQIY